MPSSLLHPPLRPQGPAPRSPHRGCLRSSGFQDPVPTPGARRNLSPADLAGGSWASPSTSGTADEVGTPPRGGLRAMPRGGAQVRAEPGAGSLPRSAGRWRRGQWLPRREAVARAGGGGGPAGAAPGLRADASPRSAAAGAVAATARATARPGAVPNSPTLAGAGQRRPTTAAPALSACAPGLAQVRGVSRSGGARPAGGGAPPGPGGPRGDTRQRRSRAPGLAPVDQAGTRRLTRSGECGGTARGLADTAAPPAASPPPNPAFAGARTAGRPGSSRPGSSRAPASGLRSLIKFLATAEVSTPGCQAARRGGPFTC